MAVCAKRGLIKALQEPAAVTLGTVWRAAGGHQLPKRVGRGQGSGRGNTCGKGHKGQRARAAAGRKIAFGWRAAHHTTAASVEYRGQSHPRHQTARARRRVLSYAGASAGHRGLCHGSCSGGGVRWSSRPGVLQPVRSASTSVPAQVRAAAAIGSTAAPLGAQARCTRPPVKMVWLWLVDLLVS